MIQSEPSPGDLSPQAKRRLLGRLLRQQASQARTLHPMPAGLRGLWFMSQLAPRSPAYNVGFAMRIVSQVDADSIREAFQILIDRHAMLRTTYPSTGDPRMEIHGAMELAFEHLTGSWSDEELDRRVQQRHTEPIDLEHGPLLRVCLFSRTSTDHVLLMVVHHIACDDWSMGILLREFRDLYLAQTTGIGGNLPPPGWQYTDHVQRQSEMLEGEDGARHLEYWRQHLAGSSPDLDLPADRPRSSNPNFHSANHIFSMDETTRRKLQTLSKGEETTLFALLLASYQVLLMRFSGQGAIVVGVPLAGRGGVREEAIVGHFVNLVPITGDLSSNKTFREYLAQTRELVLGALDHQDYPFSSLVQQIQPARHPGRTPLFRVTLNLVNRQMLDSVANLLDRLPPGESLHWADLVLKPYPLAKHEEQYDLALKLLDTGGEMLCDLQYDADLFDPETIHRLERTWATLLADIADHPDTPVEHLAIVDRADYRRIVEQWNDTTSEYPRESCIHSLFESVAERTPGALAVVVGGRRLTYGELNAWANQMAHRLMALGVGPGTLVGVGLERSVEMLVGLLGLLKAGGTYLPLDPTYPAERLVLLIQDSRAQFVLTLSALADRLPLHLPVQVVRLNGEWGRIASHSTANPGVPVKSNSLAYVTYTSGSTGQPRGVAIPHRAVVRLLFGNPDVRLDATQRILFASPLSFDASTFEIWGPLLHGGCCVLFRDRAFSTRELGQSIAKHGVTTVWLTASLFNTVIDESPEVLLEVRQLVVGGEALSVGHIRRALERLPRTEIINGYGPTEGTTFTCFYRIPRSLPASLTSIPIGRPLANTRVYILDRHLQPVPIGVPGELHISGDGLAHGYLNSPELTAEKFIADPFSGGCDARLYKTGDRARYLPDGNIEFLGRVDDQVKIRGFRIEPAEIETVLNQHPGVQTSAVVVREDTPGDKRLVAFVVGRSGEATKEDIQLFLQKSLPPHMAPSAYVFTDTLPLTEHGKVDRRALQTAPVSRPMATGDYVGPENSLQLIFTMVWEELLHVRPIGIRDNFFERGGHSLLAVRMVARIEQLCGRRLPLSSLFVEATIEHLSEVLLEQPEGPQQEEPPLVEVQPGSGKRPFFLLHGDILGGGFYCLTLARHLDSDQPFYAIHPHGVAGQRLLPTIEAMAAAHLELIRRVQPEGPYLLAGYCNAALEVFEMARQLVAQGQRVDLLVLIAPVRPKSVSDVPTVSADVDLESLPRADRRLVALWHNMELCRKYVPRRYPGRVTIFQSGKQAPGTSDASSIWEDLADEVEVQVIPGDHESSVTTNVQTTAERLRKCILAAQDLLAE